MNNEQIKAEQAAIKEAENKVVKNILNIIHEMADDDRFNVLMEAFTEINNWDGRFADDEIVEMDYLNELFSGIPPLEFVDKLDKGFNTSDDYALFSIYGIRSGGFYEVLDRLDYFDDDIADGLVDVWENIYQESLPEAIQEEINGFYKALENNEIGGGAAE